jgi:phospholipid/cholesterol/gamma-HCH transport system substrate-binding protein
MTTPNESAQPEPPDLPGPVKNLEVKASLLLVFMLVLVVGSVLYLLYARGAFEQTQRLVLMADDSEGVAVGMDMTFAGFPIGRVRRIELAEDGKARILVDVPRQDARWLRQSSVFTLERGLVGGTRIRAFSGMLADKPLDDGAVRPVLRGDAAEEIPLLLSSVRDVLRNLNAMTAEDAALRTTVANLQAITEKLNGPRGIVGLMMGNETDAKKVVTALERSNALLAKVDGLAAKADTQVFGPKGVVSDTQATVQQLGALLADARNSLKKVDAVLQEAQAIGANTREATADLGALRADVEASLRKVDSLVNEINRKWPFARDTELKLP